MVFLGVSLGCMQHRLGASSLCVWEGNEMKQGLNLFPLSAPPRIGRCDVIAFGALQAGTSFPGGSCVLSTTNSTNMAYVVATGTSVKWTGGKLITPLLNGSDPFSDPLGEQLMPQQVGGMRRGVAGPF